MMSAQQIADRHNSGVRAAKPGVGHNRVSGVDGEKLRSFIDRLEHLEQEKQSYADDIKDVMKEAVASGFDRKQIRNVMRLRKQDSEKRSEEEAILDRYKLALGME